MPATVDCAEGQARLEWWANPATCPGMIDVRVVICWTETGWDAPARLWSTTAMLRHPRVPCALNPVFTARVGDDSELLVEVQPTDRHRQPTLNECATTGSR
jgi:hypothetical protein